MDRWRRQVLPRPKGSTVDAKSFSLAEVVAMAAGVAIRSWRVKANGDQWVARLVSRADQDRDWVLVYESRMGISLEPLPFDLFLWGSKRGAMFDPGPVYEAFDSLPDASDSPAASD